MKNRIYSSLIYLLLISTLSEAQAQNRTCWRGPNWDGTSAETNLPVQWDSITGATG